MWILANSGECCIGASSTDNELCVNSFWHDVLSVAGQDKVYGVAIEFRIISFPLVLTSPCDISVAAETWGKISVAAETWG